MFLLAKIMEKSEKLVCERDRVGRKFERTEVLYQGLSKFCCIKVESLLELWRMLLGE